MREPREGDIEREILPRAVGEKVDSELVFHIEMRTRELITRGASPNNAHDKALAAFGDLGGVRGDAPQQFS